MNCFFSTFAVQNKLVMNKLNPETDNLIHEMD